MSGEIDTALLLSGQAAVIGLLIRTVGLRRLLWGLAILVYLALVVGFKTLAVIVGPRR